MIGQPVSQKQYRELIGLPIAAFGYASLPASFLEAASTLAEQSQSLSYQWNRELCATLTKEFDLSHSAWTIPEQVNSLYEGEVARLKRNIDEKAAAYFSISNDPFRKDLALLLHRFIPCGAEFATPYSGLARSILLRGGLRQAIAFLQTLIAVKGFSPFLELHMHPDVTEKFNPDGWLSTYEHLASLLESNPVLLGVQSSSWFLDPAISEISPHLAYLRDVPERCGARFFFAGIDQSVKSGALQTSRRRKELYREGSYTPRIYTRVWPRESLLKRRWRKGC